MRLVKPMDLVVPADQQIQFITAQFLGAQDLQAQTAHSTAELEVRTENGQTQLPDRAEPADQHQHVQAAGAVSGQGGSDSD